MKFGQSGLHRGSRRSSVNCETRSKYKPQIFCGEADLSEIACFDDAEMVLVAVVGTGGLRPALAAIEAGKDLAVASKEILVMAGEIVMSAAAREKRPRCCRSTASTTRFSNALK